MNGRTGSLIRAQITNHQQGGPGLAIMAQEGIEIMPGSRIILPPAIIRSIAICPVQTVESTLSMASYLLMMRAERAPHLTSDGKSVEEASCDGSC